MAGDPFGLLLRQRIVFLGGEVSFLLSLLLGGPTSYVLDCLGSPPFADTARTVCRSMTLQQMQSSASSSYWTHNTPRRYVVVTHSEGSPLLV